MEIEKINSTTEFDMELTYLHARSEILNEVLDDIHKLRDHLRANKLASLTISSDGKLTWGKA